MQASIDLVTLRNFAIALLIGALVGIEREKHKLTHGNVGLGGIRTFILFAQLGAICAWLTLHFNTPWFFISALLIVVATVISAYIAETRVHPDALGMTTEIAAVLVCLLGGIAVMGFTELAVALAIITAAALAYKQPLHGVIEKIGYDDIFAGLKLLIASFIILPLLPNTPIDPLGALNLYKLWLLVILISGLSLVGYIATRWLGARRGTLITGLAGGLVSSTAVTLSLVKKSQADSAAAAKIALALLSGLFAAWAMMFARMLALVSLLNSQLLSILAAPIGVMTGISLIAAWIFYMRGSVNAAKKNACEDVHLSNPFSLIEAGKFAIFFAVLLVLVKLAQHDFPTAGTFVVAALAAITDVDAITLSMAEFGRNGQLYIAAVATLLAAVVNTLVKCGLVIVLASRRLKIPTLICSAVILLSGIGTFYLLG